MPDSKAPSGRAEDLQLPQKSITGIAVDFGGTKMSAARMHGGVVLEEVRRLTKPDASSTEHCAAIIEAVQYLLPRPGERIGVAVTGRVDDQGCWHAINSATLSDVQSVPLKSMLEQGLGCTVSVINDAVAGAIGESVAGAGRGLPRFAYITVSTGVGGTCVIDDQALTSPNGLAGSIGFMTTRAGIQTCGSGRVGTVESVASGKAIAAGAERLGYAGYTAKDVFEHFHWGSPWAVRLVSDSAAAIAELGANLAAVAGITHMVIGGSVGLADGYRELVSSAMAHEPVLFQVDVIDAQLGQSSVLTGALAFHE